MKEVIENLEKTLQTKQEELQKLLQEIEKLKTQINRIIGALELAVALSKEPTETVETNDSVTNSNEPTSDK